jgi:hypothetical protein
VARFLLGFALIESRSDTGHHMSSLNFIGGEKGGVGKSVTARLLAQYFIDKGQTFTGFDTDRAHTTFSRFYSDFAAPVIVDQYESLDAIATAFEGLPERTEPVRVIVDLAAQTAAPLKRWIQESDLIPLLNEMGVRVNFWHIADAGKESAMLLQQLFMNYGSEPGYVVVKNQGRGKDFSQLERAPVLQEILELGGHLVTLPELHEGSMRKIDRRDASFWSAINTRTGVDALGMLERQRVKTWLRSAYAMLDELAL